MKRFSIILAAALLAASCSPETFSMLIEMRHPSRSGLDLGRKTMAVVYAPGGSDQDTLFLRGVAEGFAQAMEEDYFGGEPVIPLFATEPDTTAVLSKMRDLIMETGQDVVFLFDAPEFGVPAIGPVSPTSVTNAPDSAFMQSAFLPFKMSVYVYDSMNKEDKVLTFTGSSSIREIIYHDGTLDEAAVLARLWQHLGTQAGSVGRKSTGKFLSQWVPEQYSLYYYESSGTEWDKPSQAAYEYRWTDAIKLWTPLLKTNNLQKRACVEYDLATACYMLGNYDLALRWLDRADADCELALSPGLRKRINERIK